MTGRNLTSDEEITRNAWEQGLRDTPSAALRDRLASIIAPALAAQRAREAAGETRETRKRQGT